MLQVLFFVLNIFLLGNIYGQARLGMTEYEIRQDFSNKTFTVEEGTGAFEGNYLLGWRNEYRNVTYLIDKKTKICHTTVIFPQTNQELSIMVEKYNKEYVIISDTEWKFYHENGIIYIDLIKMKNSSWIFMFYQK